ncbi:DEAD/DEAH box helicase [Bradyrhizobium sp. JYMT SZCCT0428]|uniref:DEAD/DEAH box helicase n=1 Tax=Bradyrhizobium sp. JYMT SZCCT0428 TaxID=2807673 RepID=UPI001BA84845|nr:DEAD/DEAH box helicase [Bradyrhizobium sp. JYMT SZCCT0428]MBR1156868.1 DEAD/DEAH box helicase [Bradyrhizobium sp. JYMT SZCCT0428]
MQNAPPGTGQRASDASELGSREDIGRASCGKAQQQHNRTTAVARPVGVILRPYQALDIVRMRRAYGAGASRICYQLPTGGGKTIIFAFVTASAVRRGKRVLILGHRQEIVDQISAALTAMCVVHGIIAPLYPQTNWPVQVASVATLARRLDPANVKPFDLLVIDEAHHATASTWRSIVAAYPQAKVLGVTATPVRLDGKGLDNLFDPMICGPDVATLTKGGFLVPSTVYTPVCLPQLDQIRTRAGDYALDQLSAKMSDGALIARAVADYKARCAGVPAVAFGVGRQHSEKIAEAFREAGFKAAHVDGETAMDTRKKLIAALGTGELNVLTNSGLISEGVDVPAIGAVVLLRPTQSLALYLQQVGRALRPAPGKDRAVILDHAGNVLRHGLPDAPRQWSLSALKIRTKKRYDLRRCMACGAVNAPGPFCYACGIPPKPVIAEELDVWLELVKTPVLAGELRQMSYPNVVSWADTPMRARTAEMVRGFKRGWAWHRTRELEKRVSR